MSELIKKISSYTRAMSLAESMLNRGIITRKEYSEIDTIMTKKYGISSLSIFRKNP